MPEDLALLAPGAGVDVTLFIPRSIRATHEPTYADPTNSTESPQLSPPDAEKTDAEIFASLDKPQRPWCREEATEFKSVPLLASRRSDETELLRFRDAVQAIRYAKSTALVLRLFTVSDPLLLWAIHLELDRREVAPCIRWPANEATLQADFITWLADVLWFSKRYPLHRAPYKGTRDLLAKLPATKMWHHHAHRQFTYASRRASFSNFCADGLGLTDAHRQELMTMPTRSMRASRRIIQEREFNALHEKLYSHAIAHPDRAGQRTPEQVSLRRSQLFRTFVLAGGSSITTARYWTALTGEVVSRQAIAKQVDLVRTIADV